MDRTLCIENVEGDKCSLLFRNVCAGTDCGHYKTSEQATASRIRSMSRLRGLDEKIQQLIADKYYGGKMPWLKVGEQE